MTDPVDPSISFVRVPTYQKKNNLDKRISITATEIFISLSIVGSYGVSIFLLTTPFFPAGICLIAFLSLGLIASLFLNNKQTVDVSRDRKLLAQPSATNNTKITCPVSNLCPGFKNVNISCWANVLTHYILQCPRILKTLKNIPKENPLYPIKTLLENVQKEIQDQKVVVSSQNPGPVFRGVLQNLNKNSKVNWGTNQHDPHEALMLLFNHISKKNEESGYYFEITKNFVPKRIDAPKTSRSETISSIAMHTCSLINGFDNLLDILSNEISIPPNYTKTLTSNVFMEKTLEAPNELHFHLKRLHPRNKIIRKVTIPQKLVLPPDYLGNHYSQQKNMTYELDSVICHKGGAYGGHYVIYQKINNQWYYINDSTRELVTDIDESEIHTNGVLCHYKKIPSSTEKQEDSEQRVKEEVDAS
jgi:hypothetical protein